MRINRDYYQHYLRAIQRPLPQMQAYFAQERSYLKKLIDPSGTILDVGCGIGRNIRDLAPFAARVDGIDFDAEMIESARENCAGLHNVALYQEDFFVFDAPEKYDLTLCTYNTIGATFVHAYKREAFVKKMMQDTKTGGHVVVTFWRTGDIAMEFSRTYFSSIGVKILTIDEQHVETPEGVFRRFSWDDVDTLARSVAVTYQIVELTDIFYLLNITVM